MSPAHGRRGFALVAVLWMLVILGVLAAEFHQAARADRQAALNARDADRARWAARGGFGLALDATKRMLNPYSGAAFQAGRGDTVAGPLMFARNGTVGRADVLDARGRLNVNLAGGPEMLALFAALGMGAGDAAQAADAILDWRDSDDIPRPRGAEADLYAGLTPPIRPTNEPFESVEQLRAVWGISPAEYRLITPHLTAAGDGRVNVNTASAPVLQTLPGIDAEVARRIVERRRTAPFGSVYEVVAQLPAPLRDRAEQAVMELLGRIAFEPRTVEIVSVASVPGSRVRSEVRAVALLPGGKEVSLVRMLER